MNRPENCPSVTVLICTLNEEKNLPHVLPKIPRWVEEILLVDGHSTDRTVEVAKEMRPEIKVLYQPGKGKGDAMKYGIQQATGDVIVTLDADGQTSPEDIPRFVEPLLNRYDFAKGSRLAHGRPRNMPWHRWFGNSLIVKTCNFLYRTRFTDLCSGYNAFWRAKFLQANNIPEKDSWGYEPAIIARVLKNRMKIAEVTYCYEPRMEGSSRLPDWKQGLTAIKVLVRERFRDR
jgi:glycosyltransferase involved in cell wall biosynthesis